MFKSRFFKVFYASIVCILLLLTTFLLTACFENEGKDSTKDKDGKYYLKPEMVRIFRSFYYTGEPVTFGASSVEIVVDGSTYSSVPFNYEFENNTEVGTATLILTARDDSKYFTGSVRINFEILPGYGQTTASTLVEAQEILNGNHYGSVHMEGCFTIEQGETITIPADKHLDFDGGEVINNGTIIIQEGGNLSLGGYRDKSINLQNCLGGTIVNNGSIYNAYNGVIYNSGALIGAGTITNYSKIYTDYDLNVDNRGTNFQVVIRKELSEDLISLIDVNNGEFRYSETLGAHPTVLIENNNIDDNIDLDYSQDAIGDAQVEVKATIKSKKYFGMHTCSYTVVKGSIRCRTFAEITQAQSSGLYNSFTLLGASFLTVNENFTLNADCSLNISCQTSFGYALTNNGSLVSTKAITVYGDCVNTGTLTAPNLNSNATLNNAGIIYSDSLSLKNVQNSSIGVMQSLTENSLGISISGNFVNAGTINANTWYSSSSANITNSGIISTVSSFKLANGSQLINQTSGTISWSGESTIENINIQNDGTITNAGNVNVWDNYTDFTCAGTFDNSNGQVWAYRTMQNKGINENLNIRKRLNESTITLSQDTFVYNKASCKPSCYADGNLIESKYVSYSYVSGTANTEISNVGTIKATITIGDRVDYTHTYGGSAEITYTITPGTTSVSSFIELQTALDNKNWGIINLSADINCTTNYSTLTLGQQNAQVSSQVLNTNGNRIIIDARSFTFDNYGTINVQNIGSTYQKDSCAIQISGKILGETQYKGQLTNYGIINNDAIIYVDKCAGYLKNETSGKIYGNGEIFTWYGSPVNVEGGQVYNRSLMVAGSEIDEGHLNLSYYSADYALGVALEPSVTMKKNGEVLNNSDYTIQYSNNVNAGEASVNVSVKSDFNKYFIGGAIAYFTINKISKDVTDSSIVETSDNRYFSNKNYYQYVLKRNVQINHNIQIEDGLIIDMGPYRFTGISNNNKIVLGEDVKLYMQTNSIADFTTNNYHYVATKITLSGDIGTNGTATTISYNLQSDSVDENAYFIGEDPYNLEIDLNGYNLYARFSMKQDTNKDVNIKITNSSNNTSIFGYLNTNYSLLESASNTQNVNIELSNIQTYGMELSGGQLNLTATNCTFENALSSTGGIGLWIKKARDYKDGRSTTTSFTNCTISGYTGVYVYGGHHTFKNCTISAIGTVYGDPRDYSFNRRNYGNAFDFMASNGEPSSISIIGGTMSHTSENAYDIEVYNFSNSQTFSAVRSIKNYRSSDGLDYTKSS